MNTSKQASEMTECLDKPFEVGQFVRFRLSVWICVERIARPGEVPYAHYEKAPRYIYCVTHITKWTNLVTGRYNWKVDLEPLIPELKEPRVLVGILADELELATELDSLK